MASKAAPEQHKTLGWGETDTPLSSPPEAPSGPRSDGRYWLFCLSVALLARLVTLLPVFSGGEVQPIGTDALYHLRRIHEAVLHFPSLLTLDPYLSFPERLPNPYEPGFDLLLASFVRLLAGDSEPSFQRVAAICSIAMPFLGLLVIPLYAGIARILGGRESMRATGIFLALLPGVTFTSLAGQVDHHVLEPLVIGLPIYLTIRSQQGLHRDRTLLLAGLALGGSLLFWRGILVPAGLLAGFFGLRTVYMTAIGLVDRTTRDHAPFLFLTAAVTSLLVSIVAPVQYPEGQSSLTYFTISLLQPVVLTLLAVGMYLMGRVAVQLSQRPGPGAQTSPGMVLSPPPLPPRKELLLITLALGLSGAGPLVVAMLFWPELAQNFMMGLGFLARADAFVLSVGEQRPLFSSDTGHFSMVYALYFYGAFAVLWPLIVRLGWFQGATLRAARVDARVLPDFRWLLFGMLTVLTGVLALTQRRYAAHFAPVYCVWVGMAWTCLRSGLISAAQEGRRRPLLLTSIGGTLLTLPTFVMTGAMAATPTQPAALMEACQWILRHTPETQGFHLNDVEAGRRPEYSILSAWDEGHHLLTLAHRPNVGNPFGVAWFMPSIERAAAFWLASTETLAQRMDNTGARFALVSFRLGLLADEALFLGQNPNDYRVETTAGPEPGPRFWQLGVSRLYLDAALPSAPGRPKNWDTQDSVPGVRVIWAGGTLEKGDGAVAFVGAEAPVYQVIERVKGAAVVGKGTPGAVVTARQTVQLPVKPGQLPRTFEWRSSAKVAEDGAFELRAVYPGVEEPAGYARASGALEVSWEGQRVAVDVRESAIQSGGKIIVE